MGKHQHKWRHAAAVAKGADQATVADYADEPICLKCGKRPEWFTCGVCGERVSEVTISHGTLGELHRVER